ncbi:hypothetical protein DXG01_009204 [Tephrocybe rancida]|nr:hypothetical protein DXG01_009204 [Tephrocybe rancida]
MTTPSLTTSSPSSIPDDKALSNAANLEVLDSQGNKVAFSSIFKEQKTIVVFIRHFFCGNCQMFVEQLAAIPESTLSNNGIRIAVVGCGDWQPIQSYIEKTKFTGPIYADPTRTLYRALGMNIEKLEGTPAGQERKSYLKEGAMTNALKSIWKGPLTHPNLIGKQGNISQLGGEFVFGPGLSCSFAWRMQHTEDHIEIAELLKQAGVETT